MLNQKLDLGLPPKTLAKLIRAWLTQNTFNVYAKNAAEGIAHRVIRVKMMKGAVYLQFMNLHWRSIDPLNDVVWIA